MVAAAFLNAAAPSLAESALRDWRILSLSASPRLKLRYLLDEKLPGSQGAVAAIVQDLALSPRKDRSGKLKFSAMPILNYDRNINDGIPSDIIMIAGLPFVVSEKSRAKEGLVIGFRALARYQLPVTHGLSFETSIGVEVEHAPRWSYEKTIATSKVCLLYTTEYWSSLDVCATNIRKEAEGTEENRNQRSVKLGKVFSIKDVVAETNLTLQSQTLKGETQLALGGGATWFRPGGQLYSFSIGTGQEKPGVAFPVVTARIGLGTEIAGEATYFELGYTEESGAKFLGRDRIDRNAFLRVMRPVSNWLTADVVVQRKNSNIAELSETTFALNFTMSGLNLH